MEIEVLVFATLRRYIPELSIGESKLIEVSKDTTIAQVIKVVGLPEDEIKVIMRNHRHANLGDKVHHGDRIAFIPAVGGG